LLAESLADDLADLTAQRYHLPLEMKVRDL
jgi:hypothetical protein